MTAGAPYEPFGGAGPSTPPSPTVAAPALVDKSLRYVHVFYGTNRLRTAHCLRVATTRWDARSRCQPNAYYGGRPASVTAPLHGLEVGTLEVTFPASHAPGKLERPFQVFSFTLRDENPDRDVVISNLRSYGTNSAAWVEELRRYGRDQAFVYVHGFETTFDQAARRAGQLAYDLDFDLSDDFRGVPMMFSWPSLGGVDAYVRDYDVAEEAADAFLRFLDLVKKEAGIARVHVIAHSMGNRVVTEALGLRRDRPETLVDQLILAAPDVWATRFKDRFLRILPSFASRVTLYVSDQDRALNASSLARKDEPRAGQAAGGILEASRGVERFDAIDASRLPTDFLGHGYYANSVSMLSDIHCLLKGEVAANRPFLALAGTAWSFRPREELASLEAGACPAKTLSSPRSSRPETSPPAPADPDSGFPLAAKIGAGAALLALLACGWWLARRG